MPRKVGDVIVGAPTGVEAGMVVEARHGASATRELDLLLDGVGAQTVPLDAEAAALAISAWRRSGGASSGIVETRQLLLLRHGKIGGSTAVVHRRRLRPDRHRQ
ncbi:MAG: hypothetical protein ACRCY9_08600 [Phycicoccus sp.]